MDGFGNHDWLFGKGLLDFDVGISGFGNLDRLLSCDERLFDFDGTGGFDGFGNLFHWSIDDLGGFSNLNLIHWCFGNLDWLSDGFGNFNWSGGNGFSNLDWFGNLLDLIRNDGFGNLNELNSLNRFGNLDGFLGDLHRFGNLDLIHWCFGDGFSNLDWLSYFNWSIGNGFGD